ncbi:MAG: hypothetical protein QOK42_1657 [Frankiaceae bacterium]|nr:hypothetical protein [Frankiaceae bacterium]MDX6225130.1 hypothetical protein [Frankiales bacterium]
MGRADPFARVRRTALALPEVSERLSHGAPSFFIRGSKCFVMCMNNHHEDARIALWCAAPEGAQEELVADDPDSYFRPPYVGHRGWVGVRLDRDLPDAEVDATVLAGYRAIAPKRLLAQLDG